MQKGTHEVQDFYTYPKVQRGLVEEEEPETGLDAQTGIHFRIDMFPAHDKVVFINFRL